MGKSVRDIFDSIIIETTMDDKSYLKWQKDNRETDYRKFSAFINTVYGSFFYGSGKLSLAKLEDSFYDKIKNEMVALWNDYSYSRCVIWIEKIEDPFRLYYISEKENDNKKKQLNFYKQVCKIIYRIFQEINVGDEKRLAEARTVYENSCGIFSYLGKIIKLSGVPDVTEEPSKYVNYTNEKLFEEYRRLERESQVKRDDREYLEELNRKIELLEEIISRNDIIGKKGDFNAYKKLSKERAKRVSKCYNMKVISEKVTYSKIIDDIKSVAAGRKRLDAMEYSPAYIDLIDRCCRERTNHSDKDILEIVKEQQEQIKKENMDSMN